MTASRLFRPETRSKKPRPLRRRTGCGVRRQNGPGGGAANEGPPPRAGRRPLSALAQHHPPPQRSQPGLGSRRVGRCDCTPPGIFIHHTLSLQGPRSARPPPLQHAARWYGVGRWVLRVLNYRCRSFSRLLFTSSPPSPQIVNTYRESLTRPRFLLPLHIPLHSFSGHSLFSRRRDRVDPAASIIITTLYLLHLQAFLTTTR